MPIIAVVGIDGCGKTTQAKMLVSNLRSKGYDAEYVRPEFLLIELMKGSEEKGLSRLSPRKARNRTTGGANGRTSNAKKAVIGILGFFYALTTYFAIAMQSNRKKIIVCDRYFLQFFYNLFGKRAELVIDLFPKADITFLLEGSLETLYSRMRDPSDKSTSTRYYTNVEEMFEEVSKKHGFIRVDANVNPDLIGKELLQRVENAYS